jgi:hypothetical protein
MRQLIRPALQFGVSQRLLAALDGGSCGVQIGLPLEKLVQQFGPGERGIVRRAAHPSAPDVPLSGGPRMVEVSRDGKRVYLTNLLYGSWDDQFYPDGFTGHGAE